MAKDGKEELRSAGTPDSLQNTGITQEAPQAIMKPIVSLVALADYGDQALVDERVREAINLCGGMAAFVRPGQRVLLKVNLLMRKRPEEAVTTHPAVVEAVVKLVQAAGGQAIIGDSPGGPFSPKQLATIYRWTGMQRVAERTGAELNYDIAEVQVTHPEGRILKGLTLGSYVTSADVVIALPKLKTHGLTLYTGAVKVLFGAVPGVHKAEYHVRMPRLDDFSDMLVDIATRVRPALTVMDAVVGMEGAGPSAGKPRAIGALLASPDPFALDVVATSLVGIEPGKVPTIEAAARRGLPAALTDLTVAGESLENMRILRFALPATVGIDFFERHLPHFLAGWVRERLRPRPVFLHVSCTGCEACYRNCPPQAIQMVNQRPEVDLSKCIRCFCCQELCPQKDVVIRRPWVVQALLRQRR